MIRKLRIKLIVVSMGSLLVVLLLIVGSINALNYAQVIDRADLVLDVLEDNEGLLPKLDDLLDQDGDQLYTSPEVPYESRYFTVLLTEDGAALSTNTTQIAAVDQQEAIRLAQKVLEETDGDRGFVDDYRFTIQEGADQVRISFLDCGRWLDTCRSFLLTSILASVFGLLAVFILITLLSSRIVKPVSDSYEKQKRFITDAGHEIKTPLAIIDADASLLELEAGPSQWLEDIQLQVKRLTGLTNDLIYLAQLEEDRSQVVMLDFPFSDLVEELVHSFQAPACRQGKSIVSAVEPLVSVHGDQKMLGQLVSILLDNAVKYTEPGGEIGVRLEKQGRTVHLTVSNPTQDVSRHDLAHLFDRFYRTDRSRNSQTGGYGIGLSIASAAVAAHKGRIAASCRDGHTLEIAVSLPAGS